MVFDTIKQPQRTKTPTIGCTPPNIPSNRTPPYTPSFPPSTMPCDVAIAIPNTSPNDVGIGKPSKYLLLPVASLGTAATVTLKRARRVRPLRTKKERARVSKGVRRPSANAAVAGATPKDIYGSHQYRTPTRTRSRSAGASTYLIRERIKLLTHQTALPSPPRNFAVHEIKEQTKRY